MIPVTKAYLPNKAKYQAYVNDIYGRGWLTNNGVLVQELERRLAEYLGVKHLICVANGSLALQLAYKVLDLKGEVITTPFSFAATVSTLAWEGLTPIFGDIDPNSYNLDPCNIEPLITEKTSALVPVHVFGNPCKADEIKIIAEENNLKVIYDAAHAFGVEYKGHSILNYGDISTVSFHSTKIFHSIEGGALITNDDDLAKKIRAHINFGITESGKIKLLGTNAKMNEFEAAMGLCVLDEIDLIRNQRKDICKTYQQALRDLVTFQSWNKDSQNNYAYAPVLFKSEEELLRVNEGLNIKRIFARRYFYPSLDTLNYLQPEQILTISRDISERILCLPLYSGLAVEEQEVIVDTIMKNL